MRMIIHIKQKKTRCNNNQPQIYNGNQEQANE
jgi:hypothetical protein